MGEATANPVEVARDRHITIVSLHRAARRNAIDPSITAGIGKVLNDFEDNTDQRCAILTGDGH
jgi:enoyl-CoA hydratase/carnithine racemase